MAIRFDSRKGRRLHAKRPVPCMITGGRASILDVSLRSIGIEHDFELERDAPVFLEFSWNGAPISLWCTVGRTRRLKDRFRSALRIRKVSADYQKRVERAIERRIEAESKLPPAIVIAMIFALAFLSSCRRHEPMTPDRGETLIIGTVELKPSAPAATLHMPINMLGVSLRILQLPRTPTGTVDVVISRDGPVVQKSTIRVRDGEAFVPLSIEAYRRPSCLLVITVSSERKPIAQYTLNID